VGGESGDVEEVMATQPKPKPKPEPDPPEPKPEDDAAVRMVPPQYREGGLHAEETTDASIEASADSLERLHQRLDALFTSQTALIDRVEKLEERVNAPPIGLGRRS
jgi:hypothetical protein